MPTIFEYESLTHVSLRPLTWEKVATDGPEVLQPTYHDVIDTFTDFSPTILISPFKPGTNFAQLLPNEPNVDVYSSINGGVCILPRPKLTKIAPVYWLFNANPTYTMNMVRIPAYTDQVINYYIGQIQGNYFHLGNNINGDNADILVNAAMTIYLADWYRTSVTIQNTSIAGEVVRIAVGIDPANATTGYRLTAGASITIDSARQRITAFNESGNPTISAQAVML